MADATDRWERVAERTTGDVAGLALAPADGRALVFAATAVGVYRSANGGHTWTLPGAGAGVPFAEVVAPSPRFAQDRTLFVSAGNALYRSSDGGETWREILVGSRMLSVVTALDGEPESLVVLAGTETDGVLRSGDGGRSWIGANAGLLDLTVIALAVSPAFASDRVGFAGTASALYRTRNGARSWREVDTGLADEVAVQCLAVSPTFAEDRLVLAGTEAHGLLRSEDAGGTWQVPASLAGRCVTALAFSAEHGRRRTIAAATEGGIAVSRDGGKNWHMTGTEPVQVLSLVCMAHEGGETLLAGLHRRGAVRSEDGGTSWMLANAGLNASLVVGLALSPAFARDQTVFVAGLQDGVSVSRDGGRTWALSDGWADESAALGAAVSPNFARDQTVYAATPGGVNVSRDGGVSWQQSIATSAPVRAVISVSAADPAGTTALAAVANGQLLDSDDGGATWRAARNAAFGGAEIVSLAGSADYSRDRTVFVTTKSASDAVVWRSTNGGEQWARWLVEPGQHDTVQLAISPNYSADELVFVGLGGRVLSPRQDARAVHASKRRNVWRDVELGGGATAVTALAVSPAFARDRTLLVATNAGIFVSRDGGQTYQNWSEGLPQPPRITALSISPTYPVDGLVYAVGLGGTIWRRLHAVRLAGCG